MGSPHLQGAYQIFPHGFFSLPKRPRPQPPPSKHDIPGDALKLSIWWRVAEETGIPGHRPPCLFPSRVPAGAPLPGCALGPGSHHPSSPHSHFLQHPLGMSVMEPWREGE